MTTATRIPIVLLLGAAAALAGAASYAGAQAATSTASAAATAPIDTTTRVRPRRLSWTSDRREFAVGDVITVLVDEYTAASQDKQTSALDAKSRDLNLGLTVKAASTTANIGTRNNSQSENRGEATRQNRFRSEISVRVVAVAANGLLQIRGHKVVNIEKNEQDVSLTGWVRPQDISQQNLVDAFRVADGELVFSEKGDLGKPKGGIIGRMLGKLWP